MKLKTQLVCDASQRNIDKIKTYLRCGFSDQYYSIPVGKKEFYEEFYVKMPPEKQQLLVTRIMQLHEQGANILILKAHSGNGKSVFLNLFPLLLSENNGYSGEEVLYYDFFKKHDTSWLNLLEDRSLFFINKWLENIPTDSPYYIIADYFFNSMNFGASCSSDKKERFKNFFSEIHNASKRKERRTHIENTLNSLIQDNSLDDAEKVFLMLLSVISIRLSLDILEIFFEKYSKLSSTKMNNRIIQDFQNLRPDSDIWINNLKNITKRRYYFLFDNVEVFQDSTSTNLSSIFNKVKNMFCNAFVSDDAYPLVIQNIKSKFIFIIAARTTNADIIKVQERLEGDAAEKLESAEYEAYDFFSIAIYKKITYLKKIIKEKDPNFMIEQYPMLKELEEIGSILYAQNVLKAEFDFTKLSDEAIANKKFIDEVFAPFWGNNYRNAINRLIDIKLGPNKQIITDLINLSVDLIERNEKKIAEYVVNGLRNIIFREIYDEFVDENILNYFSFDEINGEKECSLARLLLMYLFWMQKGVASDERITVSSFIKRIKSSGICAIDDLNDILYKLSFFQDISDQTRMLHIKKWSYLIEFFAKKRNGEYTYFVGDWIKDIKPEIEQLWNNNEISTLLQNMYISLSPAGKAFFEHSSSEYEFLASRIPFSNRPKCLYANYINDTKSIDNVDNDIKKVVQAIKDYVDGMLDFKCFTCQKNCCKKYLNAPYQCGVFMRCQECFTILSKSIAYLDRYRLYQLYFLKFSNELLVKEFNRKVLEQMKELICYFNHVRKVVSESFGGPQFMTNVEELAKSNRKDIKGPQYHIDDTLNKKLLSNLERLKEDVNNTTELYTFVRGLIRDKIQ